jgi:hypothetical protein
MTKMIKMSRGGKTLSFLLAVLAMFVAGVARADVTSTIAAPFSGDIDLGGGKLVVE